MVNAWRLSHYNLEKYALASNRGASSMTEKRQGMYNPSWTLVAKTMPAKKTGQGAMTVQIRIEPPCAHFVVLEAMALWVLVQTQKRRVMEAWDRVLLKVAD